MAFQVLSAMVAKARLLFISYKGEEWRYCNRKEEEKGTLKG